MAVFIDWPILLKQGARMLITRERYLLKKLIGEVPVGRMFAPNMHLHPDIFELASLLQSKFWDEHRYPGIFSRLRRLPTLHSVYSDSEIAVRNTEGELGSYFGLFEAGVRLAAHSFSATGIGAVAGGFHTADLTIYVIDNEAGIVVGHARIHGVDDIYVRETLIYEMAADHRNYTVMMQGSWEHRNGEPNFVFQKLAHDGETVQASDPTISHPVRRSNNPDPTVIAIGLGRSYTDQGPGSTMDYAWNQATENHPKGMVPFVGRARFDRPIMPLQPNQTLIVTMAVVNLVGGGGYIEISPINMGAVYAGFAIDPSDPNALTWNFRPGQTTSDPGSPVVFENVKWPADMKAMFFFKAFVFLQGKIPAMVSVRSHDGLPANPPDGHLPILPISFIWHCVGADSTVLMADGTEKAIVDIVAGEVVATGPAMEPAEVAYTTKGTHGGKVLEITTEDRRTIVATDNHVFLTEEGSCLAQDLTRNMKILSNAGRVKDDLGSVAIVKIAQIDGYDAQLCGIATRPQAGKQMGTFYANGFLVGDDTATSIVTAANRQNIEYVKSKVPAIYHRDVESHFEDFAGR